MPQPIVKAGIGVAQRRHRAHPHQDFQQHQPGHHKQGGQADHGNHIRQFQHRTAPRSLAKRGARRRKDCRVLVRAGFPILRDLGQNLIRPRQILGAQLDEMVIAGSLPETRSFSPRRSARLATGFLV